MRRRLPALLLAFAATATLAACATTGQLRREAAPVSPHRVLLAYTNDEHGWIEGVEPGRGAAELSTILAAEAEAAQAELLLVSGGDNWTGPAISTWFDGEPVVEVMNAMGYRATAVGNHEFDFGLEAMAERIAESAYPYLAANLRRRADGRIPEELGVRAWTLVESGPARIGLIGLVTPDTPRVTNPVHVADFEFLPMEPALREAAAAARAAGATELVALVHDCVDEVRALAQATADLGVAVYGAGHCNERHAERLGDSLLLSSRGHFRSVALARLDFDARTGRLTGSSEPRILTNRGGAAQPAIAELVGRWRVRTEAQLGTVLTELEEPLPQRSPALERLIARSWLEAIPSGEVALLNRGGIRAGLPAGPVTIADVVAVLPFQNTIVQAGVPGAVLERALREKRVIVGGLRREDDRWRLESTGEPLDPERRYRVLANSFCYAGGDGWDFLARSDPEAYDTGIHWRQPLIDLLAAR